MQQHFIDTSINITELESIRKAKKLPKNVGTLPEKTLGNSSLRGGRVGKTVALSGKKRKLTQVTKRETNTLARTQVSHSV